MLHDMAKLETTERTTLRLMWILISLTSTCYCSHLVIGSFTQYFKFESIAKTKIVAEKLVIFRAVTLFNILIYTHRKKWTTFSLAASLKTTVTTLWKVTVLPVTLNCCKEQQRVELKISNKMG